MSSVQEGCGAALFTVCGPAMDDCFAEERKGASNQDWAYVGEKRGGYEKVFTYRYVGEGRGDFDVNAFNSPGAPAGRQGMASVKWWLLCGTTVVLAMIVLISTVMLLAGPLLSRHHEGHHGEFVVHSPTPGPAPISEVAVGRVPRSMIFDCEANFSDWRRTWSQAKMRFCCREYKRGCKEEEEPRSYDCHSGADGSGQAWSFPQKQWCCSHKRLGCPEAAPKVKVSQAPSQRAASLPRACFAKCSHGALNTSCGIGIQLVANRNFAGTADACGVAYTQVIGLCPLCAGCTPVLAGCLQPKRAVAVAAPVAEGREAAGRNGSSPTFNCSAGYANFARSWTPQKKAWCCKHQKRGCPPTVSYVPYDCTAGFDDWESGWSDYKKAWCCKNEQRGCPKGGPKLFDCIAGFSNWKRGWSSAKMAWCCRHTGRGCISPRG